MAIVDALLPEFDRETTTTRKLLERVPDDKWDWKPDRKSTRLNSSHVSESRMPSSA